MSIAIALRIVRPADATLAGLLDRERALLRGSTTAKRRAEFTAGRRAARAALLRLVGERARGAAILRDESTGTARPVAVSAAGSPLAAHLSITHADGLAAAAAGAVPLGLDLVALEPLGASFREEAFEPAEIAAWERWLRDGGSGAPADCVAFAAKEAVLKWLGTGLALPLRSVRVVPGGAGARGRLRWPALRQAQHERNPGLAVSAFPLDVEAPGIRARLDAWMAASSRRVLIAASGPQAKQEAL